MSLQQHDQARGGDTLHPGRYSVDPQSAPDIDDLVRPEPPVLNIPDSDVAWWVKTAEDCRTPPALLTFLSTSENEAIVIAVAANTETPEETLVALSTLESSGVLESLSYNPQVPSETLTAMFYLDEYGLACPAADGLAANSSTSQDTLRALHAAEVSVYDIARNPNCPPDLLETILLTGGEFERRCALENEHLTAMQLERASYDPDPSVRKAVLRTSSVTADIVARYATDDDESMREWVAGSYRTPSEILVRMQADVSPAVVKEATASLEQRHRMERNRY